MQPSDRYSRTGGKHGSGGRDFGSSGSDDFGRGAAMNDGDRDGEAPVRIPEPTVKTPPRRKQDRRVKP